MASGYRRSIFNARPESWYQRGSSFSRCTDMPKSTSAAAARHEARVEKLTRFKVHTRRIPGVGVAVGKCKLLRLDHEVDEICAAPLVRSEVEPLRDGELLEKDVTLRHRRLTEDAESAVVDGERL